MIGIITSLQSPSLNWAPARSLDSGRSTIKSIDNSDHGLFGVERGEGRP